MTRAGALPHRVTLTRRDITGRDARNNETAVDLPPLEDIPARVELENDGEDIATRDRKTETALVTLPHQWRGAVLELDSVDAFRFNGKDYELVGEATLVDDHAGRHDHFELVGQRITG